jgi:hypothetical protein
MLFIHNLIDYLGFAALVPRRFVKAGKKYTAIGTVVLPLIALILVNKRTVLSVDSQLKILLSTLRIDTKAYFNRTNCTYS